MNFVLSRTSLLLVAILTLGLAGLSFGQDLPFVEQAETLVSGDYTNGVVEGDYLYIASGYGLAIYDVSDPGNPAMVLNFGTEGEASDVAVFEDYAFVADGYKGLTVVDISDPANPWVAAELGFEGRARSLAIDDEGDFALVALEAAGFALVDISDPDAPVTLDVYATTSRALDASFYEGYVYTSTDDAFISLDYAGGLLAFIQEYAVTAGRGVIAHGGLAYIADFDAGVEWFELVGSGQFDWQGTLAVDSPLSFGEFGTYVAVAQHDTAYDADAVTIISGGTTVGSFAAADMFEYAFAAGVFGWGDYLYVGEGNFGFQILDASNPGLMVVEGDAYIAGGARNSVVYGDYCFVAYYTGGVKILDIADPQNVMEVGTIEFGPDQLCYDVDVIGDMLYVVEFWSGVYSYDISNPLNPVFDTHAEILPVDLEGTRACATDGENLYVVHYADGLYKFGADLALLAGPIDTDGQPRDIKVDNVGMLAFVADYAETGSGAVIFDLSGDEPAILSAYQMAKVRAVDFYYHPSYDILFVGSEDEGLDIVDFSNPAAPALISSYATAGDVNGLVVDGLHYAYLCDWTHGIEAVYTLDPTDPVQAGYYDTHSLGKAAFVDGNYLHVSDSYSYYVFAIGGAVDVSLPVTTGDEGSQVMVPIMVSDVTGLFIDSWETSISWDETILTYADFETAGTLCEGWTIIPNAIPGNIQIGGFSAVNMAGEGVMVYLVFDVVGTAGQVTDLAFDDFMFNDGRPIAYTTDGELTVTAVYLVDGMVTYYMGTGDPVAGMDVVFTDLIGGSTITATTDETGYYAGDLWNSDWRADPEKTEETHVPIWIINFGDAVLTAQGSVGLVVLTENQQFAGDVTGNGVPPNFNDASDIAQYAVMSIDQFDVAVLHGSDWLSDPEFIEYIPLTSNMTDDYLGILYGDVDGNWSATTASAVATNNNDIFSDCVMENEMVTIPINVTGDPEETFFFQGELLYDAELLEFQSITLDGSIDYWNLFSNAEEAGHLRFGAFDVDHLPAAGTVAYVTFEILNNTVEIDLTLDNFFTKANSSMFTASISIRPDGVPTSYALKQNYPNPFNPDTNILFDLKDRGNVNLTVYNALGQKVRTLIDQQYPAGAYSFIFDGKDDRGLELSSGLYFYQIKSNGFNDTKKMIMIK